MIINKTNKKKIAGRYLECSSILSQIRGMMFRKKVIPLVFTFSEERKVNLHSFFCKEMDLVFLNSKFEVVEMKKNWKPFSFYSSKRKAKFLLELPTGSIYKRIELGDLFSVGSETKLNPSFLV